jgi:hypothetical protein
VDSKSGCTIVYSFALLPLTMEEAWKNYIAPITCIFLFLLLAISSELVHLMLLGLTLLILSGARFCNGFNF